MKNVQLKEETKRLKEITNIELNIERYKDAYITLKNDSEKLIYCSCCWNTKKDVGSRASSKYWKITMPFV